MVRPSKRLPQSFELQIWIITIGLAAVRGLIGVIDDLLSNPIHLDELMLDSCITILFIILTYFIYAGKLSKIPIWISILFILLLCINYYQFGGVGNGAEFNLIGLGVLLVLANKARPLKPILIFYFSIILCMLLEDQYIGWMSSVFYIESSNSKFDFLLMLVTISLIVLYFKQVLLRESTNLDKIKLELTKKKNIVEQQNDKLSEQKEYIDITNHRLNAEFINQSGYLIKNNESIEKFVQTITESFDDPLEQLVEHANNIQTSGDLESMVKKSSQELHEVISNLKLQLK